ncbi:MAG TPA: peptidylprolyl isomerase [Terriglobales bacterium]|nr:peptidylprolyl isomerase [Terriglobales bacterium]
MTRYGFVCLLLGAMAWGQAAPKTAPAAQKPAGQSATAPNTGAAEAPQEAEASKVPPDAPVITIKGLCDQSAPKSPALECRTVITRAQFEQVVEAVQPNMPARVRRQFATRYASALAMSKKAEELGLDKGPSYEEHMKLARIQVLATEFNKAMQEKASQITDKEIEDYYKSNQDKFEEVEANRIYIPKAQQPSAEEDKGDDKDKDKEKKASEEEQQKRAQASEETMKKEADKLRVRAAAGEDFNKLQEAAYQVAGIKSSAPNTTMSKLRRNMLPPSQAFVIDLKAGEVSQVISDQSGYFIYKVVSKQIVPLDQAREEIKGTLRSQRLQEEMKEVQESSTPVLDEAYFGPEMPRGPVPPRGPMPPGAPGTPPPATPPAPPGPK